jgi:hypothetical protein
MGEQAVFNLNKCLRNIRIYTYDQWLNGDTADAEPDGVYYVADTLPLPEDVMLLVTYRIRGKFAFWMNEAIAGMKRGVIPELSAFKPPQLRMHQAVRDEMHGSGFNAITYFSDRGYTIWDTCVVCDNIVWRYDQEKAMRHLRYAREMVSMQESPYSVYGNGAFIPNWKAA